VGGHGEGEAVNLSWQRVQQLASLLDLARQRGHDGIDSMDAVALLGCSGRHARGILEKLVGWGKILPTGLRPHGPKGGRKLRIYVAVPRPIRTPAGFMNPATGRPVLPDAAQVHDLVREAVPEALAVMVDLATQDQDPKLRDWARADLVSRFGPYLKRSEP
jgi:hypothetical protein